MGDRTVRQWIRDTHVPMVMTSVTEEAERSCKKNGLTFTEMLSAFATVQCTVPIRTVAHHYSLKQFRLRFVPSAEVAPLPVELADRHLARVVNARVPAAEQLLEHAPIDDGTSTDDARARCSALRGTTTGSTPWYASFVRGLWASTQCQEHEMLDCPAACLLVVSSANDEPINCFDELGSPHYLPQVFQRGQFLDVGLAFLEELVHHEEVELVQVHRYSPLRVEVAELAVGQRVGLLVLESRNPPRVEARPPEAELAGQLHQHDAQRELSRHQLVEQITVPLSIGAT